MASCSPISKQRMHAMDEETQEVLQAYKNAMYIEISRDNWPSSLAEAINAAQPWQTIIVHDEWQQKLCESAAARLGKPELRCIIKGA